MSNKAKRARWRTMTIGLGDAQIVWEDGVAYLQVDDWCGQAPQRVYVHLGALGDMAGWLANKIRDDVKEKLKAALERTGAV